MSGSRSRVRPPKMIASIGTPFGSSKSGATFGTFASVVVEVGAVPVGERVGREHHREVRLARSARETAADVVPLAGQLVGNADEHELLGEELARRPAVVGGLPQPVCDLAEQRVAAVGRAEVQYGPLVGDCDKAALVTGRTLAELLEITGNVHRAD